jgi:hypothetical protein
MGFFVAAEKKRLPGDAKDLGNDNPQGAACRHSLVHAIANRHKDENFIDLRVQSAYLPAFA